MKPVHIDLPLGIKPCARPFARGSGRPVEIKAAGGEVTITMFGEISPWDISASAMKAALSSAAGKPVSVEINSPGGDAFEGVAIYNLLAAYQPQVTTKVLGLAASAASIIAMAGDTVQIAENGFLMVHQSWGFTIGNSADHLDQAEVLQQVDAALALTYANKTGDTVDEMLTLMAAETWLAGQAAVDAGFADSLLPTPSSDASAKAGLDLTRFNYRHVPAGLSGPPQQRPDRAELRSRADVQRILVSAGVRRRAAQIVADTGFAALAGEPSREQKEWRRLAACIDAAAAQFRSTK